ncbi:MAG: 3-beta hydroxysteroid dehydrogenase, partial [Solirubrobacteraceae bacterium]
MSVRFAPTVHGKGENGFTAMIVAADRASGQAAYIGEATNRWAAVHRSDAARLVRLAIELAPARSVLHAVGEQGVALRDFAEAIGRRFGLAPTAVSPEGTATRVGFLAEFVGLDMPAASASTRELIRWEPTGPTLIEDIQAGAYANGSQGVR